MVWDELALRDAKAAVWSDPDWEDGQVACLQQLPAMPAGGQVLDLGCGVGRLAWPYADMWPLVEVWAVDPSLPMLEQAPPAARVHYVHSDGLTIPKAPKVPDTLDGAWSVAVFQHLPPVLVQGYISQVAGRLREGGWFRFQWVPDADTSPPLSYGHAECDVLAWVSAAGLQLEAADSDLVRPGWTWFTVTRQGW